MEEVPNDKSKIRQISLGLSTQAGKLMSAEERWDRTWPVDVDRMRASLLHSAREWPHDTYLQGCQYPMVVPKTHLDHLETLASLLQVDITNIVERWWSDTEKHFPERMPLELHEEDVLRVSTTLTWHLLNAID